MRLLIVRHARAEDYHPGGDPARNLTDEGQKRTWAAARGLKTRIKTLDRLATSPYTRAVQTAEILAEIYGGMPVHQCQALEPGTPVQDQLAWLQTLTDRGTLAIVGHEPGLSLLITRLVCARDEPIVAMKKGGACLLELPQGPIAGGALIRRLMSARELADLDK